MCAPTPVSTGRLMVSGPSHAGDATVEVRRGMDVHLADGEWCGVVACVLVDETSGLLTHLIVGSDPAAGDYRLVPIDRVVQVDITGIRLNLATIDLARLPRHVPEP